MSKILITGNGFDLYYGLPTKYGHFMTVMRIIEKLKEKEEYNFYDLFDESFGLEFFNDNENIHKYYDIENIKFNKDKIQKIKEQLNQNLWYSHFKTVLELETWIDFETEIENVLDILVLLLRHVNENNQDGFFNLNKNIYYRDIKNLNIIEVVNTIAFEINREFISPKTKLPDEKKIFKKLANSLEDFILIFNNYLVNVVGEFYEIENKILKIPLEKITEIYTFNYTPTLERIFKVDKSKIAYLHGKSNEFEKNQNLVLGIDEISDLVKANKMFEFTKYYQKVRKETKHNFIKLPKEKTNSLGENTFYIIGHSLDKSDKEYIVKLFDFLELDLKNFSKICVFYFDEKDRSNKLKNLFSIINKDIITKLDNEKRLYFIKLTDSNIKFEFENTVHNISSEYRISVF